MVGEGPWTRALVQLQTVLVPPLALTPLQEQRKEGFNFTGFSVLPVTSSLLPKVFLNKASREMFLLKLQSKMWLFRNSC